MIEYLIIHRITFLRLEFYDVNDAGPVLSAQTSWSMSTPEAVGYKDLNADSKLPTVTTARLADYLQFEKKFEKKITYLYEERYDILYT